jgi:threonine/homoserine/homoserine lactone efflux protein
MTPTQTSAAFFAVSVALALAPGPDNHFVLVQSALHGRRAGLAVVLGLCTGLVFHTAAVAVGLAAVLAASERAFALVKYAGAAYLALLAWQAFRAPAASDAVADRPISGSRLYLRGIVMNVSNPKVAIFFLAFLPQFVDADRGDAVAQIAWLGLLFIAATLLTFGAIAWFAGALGGVLRPSPRVRLLMNRLAGCIFLALALRLAMAQR